MKRLSVSSSEDNVVVKKECPTIVLPAELTNVSLENIQIASPVLHLQPECATEVVHSEDGTKISQHDIDDSSASDSNFGTLIEFMDITEPLNTLRSLLEQRTGSSLTDHKFYLQDTQELESTKNLVNQCVQGEGLVQINVDIIEKQGIKKINIIDVLKPAEEIPLSPDLTSPGDSFSETPTSSQKVVSPSSDDSHQVTRWTVDPEFRRLQDKLNIPQDPILWSEEHVKNWVEWASIHFNLPEVDINDWNFSGIQLMNLSHDSFKRKIPFDPSDLFWTHLELLRKFKIVAVIQPSGSSLKELSSLQKNTALKCKPRAPRIGSPRIAYDGGPGNNGQIQLWQFLLELLTDKDHRDFIQWVGDEGEFKLINPEMVAQLWGHRKNKPTMNYEKLSRALRYYYDGEMIAKVHGKRFVYKFVCDLKGLLGYDASELNRLVSECENKSGRNMDSSALLAFASSDGNSNS